MLSTGFPWSVYVMERGGVLNVLYTQCVCIAIRYCDFIVIPCSLHISYHMFAAEGQERDDEKMSLHQSKC